MKKGEKAKTDHFILKQTWNRNIIYGPYPPEMFDRFVNEFAWGPEARGGPVRFTLLKAVQSSRVVKRHGGRVGIERSPSGNVQTKTRRK